MTRLRHALLPVLLLALWLTGCSEAPRDTLPAGSTVLALGDSLTAGNGVRPEQAWPALLGRRSGWDVINAGVSGNTSAQALARLDPLLEEHAPDLVIVTLGGNDMLQKLDETSTVANLRTIVQRARAAEARVVLVAVPRPSLGGALFRDLEPAAFYRPLADELGVPLVEDPMSEVLSDPDLKVDRLHPNAAGHAEFNDRLVKALAKLGML